MEHLESQLMDALKKLIEVTPTPPPDRKTKSLIAPRDDAAAPVLPVDSSFLNSFFFLGSLRSHKRERYWRN